MSNQVNISINMPGNDGDGKPKRPVRRMVTLELAKEWIYSLGFDEYTTKGLIEIAGKYPTSSLPSIKRNLNTMLARVRSNRTKEMEGIVENKSIDSEVNNEVKPIEEAKVIPPKQSLREILNKEEKGASQDSSG